MSTITFKDTNETFEIMAQDKRYLICQRPYTVAERALEIKKHDEGFEEALKEEFETVAKHFNYDYDEFCDDDDQRDRIWDNYSDECGEQPEPLSEDTFCYTIVDLQEKKRAPDNYYCKFNYDKKEECKKALKELNTITKESKGTPCEEYEMQLSRRRSIELSEYEIKE